MTSKKNIKNGYRIGIETKKGIKLSKDQYTLGDASRSCTRLHSLASSAITSVLQFSCKTTRQTDLRPVAGHRPGYCRINYQKLSDDF